MGRLGVLIVMFGLIAAAAVAQSSQASPSQPSHHKATRKAPTPTPQGSPAAAMPADDNVAGHIIGMTFFILLGAVMYFLPMLIAAARKHHNANAIAVTNFLLGWTVVGWIASLIWACTSPPPRAG